MYSTAIWTRLTEHYQTEDDILGEDIRLNIELRGRLDGWARSLGQIR